LAYSAIIKLPFSTLGVTTRNETLQAIEFLARNTDALAPQDRLAREVVAQLDAYCRDSRFSFDLPLAKSATTFQRRVREALLAIPVGQVLSYAELAHKLDSGARAVAMACRHNPLPVLVPCHRIVAKNSMGGYAGATSGKPVEIKRWLLEHECASEFRPG
jgi:methylated-DNA-[protein]-cysteine S-methyltransferase